MRLRSPALALGVSGVVWLVACGAEGNGGGGSDGSGGSPSGNGAGTPAGGGAGGGEAIGGGTGGGFGGAPETVGSLRFVENGPGDHEYARHTQIPADFGAGELTLEVLITLETKPVGGCADAQEQLVNWCDDDSAPYSDSGWWYTGNFLLDGHNNASFGAGTFSLQFYGGGRLRWLLGDGGDPGPGDVWAVQAFPASSTPSLIDDQQT